MHLPIFLYHHVVHSLSKSDLAPYIVDQEAFRWQMDLLEDSGYHPITLSALFSNDYHPGEKNVILTFDDCPRNLLDFAVPYLEQKKWKAVFFPPVGFLGGYNEWNVRKGKTRMELMSGEEIKRLSTAGHEVGGHSVNHLHLHQCSPEELRYELIESKIQLERLLQKPVVSFAYPYGHYPKDYQQIMAEAGYAYAVSMYSTSPSILADPFRIRRTVVETSETKKSFRWKLSLPYNFVRVFSDWFTLRKEGLLR